MSTSFELLGDEGSELTVDLRLKQRDPLILKERLEGARQ